MDILPTGAWACEGMPVGAPCICEDGLTDGTCQPSGAGMDCVPSGRGLGTTSATGSIALGLLGALAVVAVVGWWKRDRVPRPVEQVR